MRRISYITLFVMLAATFLVACGSSSSPDDGANPPGACATDFSCAFNEECKAGGCAAITPGLRSHIQTASCLLRPPLDASEATWRAFHNDLLIASFQADEARAANPNVRLFEYVVTRFNRFDRVGVPKTAMQWASTHGYDGEDFYLHYREDTTIPTWEGRTIVPDYPAGMVPGWNPGGGNATADTRAQSRVVGYYYGTTEPWYFANMADPGYRAFLVHNIAGLIDGTWYYNQKYASGPLDGVMIDDAIWYPMFGEGLLHRSDEYYGVSVNDGHPYTYALENSFPGLAVDMRDEFGSARDIMPNYGHVLFMNYPNRCAQNIQDTTPWVYGEVWVSYTGTSSPTSGGNRCISEDYDYEQGIRQIVKQTRAGGRRIVGARDTASGPAGTDRGKLLTLGLYYLIHNAHTYYMYESAGHAHGSHVSTWAWNPAVTFDIGQPDVIPAGKVDFDGKANTREHYVFATGSDPVINALTYRVYARQFTNALVLVKLLPAGSATDDTSITTHTLDGTYVPLLADGNMGAPITQASIRNNEALILIPLD